MRTSEVKLLYELFNNKSRVQAAINSIESGFVELHEIESEEFFWHNGHIYSSEDYVTDIDGDLLDRIDSFWCNGIEDYVHVDDTVTVYEGREEMCYSRRYAERNSDLYYYDGDYYDDYALERHDIVWCEDTGEYTHRDNAYWCEDNECYYSEDRGHYIRGYHNGSYQSITFDNKSKYKIGYEIEKEDENVRNSIHIEEFERKTGGYWRKEKDGSLCDESGYELISPTFEFNIKKIFEHIESNEQLVAHINANHGYSCGGHIHLSEKDLSGDELFNKIKGYTPLFYALYYGRVNKSYSKGKSNRDLQEENEKYQAIRIHHDRVEFRIISAVPDVKTLKWRTKLISMILKYPTDDIIHAYYNVDTKFTKLLKEVYSDEKLVQVKERFIRFTREFEQLEIKNNN